MVTHLHHAALLLLRHSKRIRLLAATLHAIALPLLIEKARTFFLSAWDMAAHDSTSTSLLSFLHPLLRILAEAWMVDLLPFLHRALLDSKKLWAAVNPTIWAPSEEQHAEEAEQGECEADRNARLKIGTLGACGDLGIHTILHFSSQCTNYCLCPSRCIAARS